MHSEKPELSPRQNGNEINIYLLWLDCGFLCMFGKLDSASLTKQKHIKCPWCSSIFLKIWIFNYILKNLNSQNYAPKILNIFHSILKNPNFFNDIFENLYFINYVLKNMNLQKNPQSNCDVYLRRKHPRETNPKPSNNCVQQTRESTGLNTRIEPGDRVKVKSQGKLKFDPNLMVRVSRWTRAYKVPRVLRESSLIGKICLLLSE